MGSVEHLKPRLRSVFKKATSDEVPSGVVFWEDGVVLNEFSPEPTIEIIAATVGDGIEDVYCVDPKIHPDALSVEDVQECNSYRTTVIPFMTREDAKYRMLQ